jgi:hypothetical protein
MTTDRIEAELTDRARCSFVVYSPSLSVAEISSALGREPDLVENIGDRTGGGLRVATETAWTMRTKLPPTAAVADQLEELLAAVLGLEPRIQSLEGRVTCDLVVWQVMNSAELQGHSFVVEERWIGALNRVNGRLVVDQFIQDPEYFESSVPRDAP